jgi:hypothetical protein
MIDEEQLRRKARADDQARIQNDAGARNNEMIDVLPTCVSPKKTSLTSEFAIRTITFSTVQNPRLSSGVLAIFKGENLLSRWQLYCCS